MPDGKHFNAHNAQNIHHWDKISGFWDKTLADGNDMYLQLLLPIVEQMAKVQPGNKILDLATGNGIVARRLAGPGVEVFGADASQGQLDTARARTSASGKSISFQQLDLLDPEAVERFATEHEEEFDIVTTSMLLTDLADLVLLAQLISKIMKPSGRFVMANLHPCFHKPGAHRAVEILENPKTGVQEFHTHIKVISYLSTPPVQTEAIRGQPYPVMCFHRSIQDMFEPFFQAGLALIAIKEPSFDDGADPKQIQSYHNFAQIPMLFITTMIKVP